MLTGEEIDEWGRGTGTTTQQLGKCVEAAKKGQNTIYLVNHMREAAYCMNLLADKFNVEIHKETWCAYINGKYIRFASLDTDPFRFQGHHAVVERDHALRPNLRVARHDHWAQLGQYMERFRHEDTLGTA